MLKHIQISNFIKTSPEGGDLFHTDRRTDRQDEDNILFSQFCESA
jgi:hypothetical protein